MHIDHIFVLAGGRGSRSADPSIPKFVQSLSDDVEVADYLLELLQDFPEAEVTWILGEHSDAVLQRIKARASLDRVVLNQVSGTAAALREASKDIGDGQVLVMLADTVMALPLWELIDRLPNSDGSWFFGRHSDHAWDSDHLVIGEGGEITDFISKSDNRSAPGLALALSGITITSASILKGLTHGDAQQEIYRLTIESGKIVRAINSSWFLRDTGTPDRLHRVSRQHIEGSISRRSALQRAAIFIDRDGTLIPDIGECRSAVAQDEIPERVRSAIRCVNNVGIPIFLITNQPGIAKGCIRELQVLATFQDIAISLGNDGAFLDGFYFCPHHPDSGWQGEVAELKVSCECRKPAPGMLLDAATDHFLDLNSSLIIGDTARDEGAATAIGAAFSLVSWSENGEQVASAILDFANTVMLRG